MLSLTVACSMRVAAELRVKLRMMPVALLSGMATVSPDWVLTTDVGAARLVQVAARLTAAVASISPAPKS